MNKTVKKLWHKLVKWNNAFAMALTKAMSSMVCVYIFFVWCLVPLAFPKLETFCMYVSSTVIQLVALPLLAVGTNLLGKSQERRAATDHTAIAEIKADVDNLTIMIQEIAKTLGTQPKTEG
jgi:hypothetical protein